MPLRTIIDIQDGGHDSERRLHVRAPKKRARRDTSDSDAALGRGCLGDVEMVSDYKSASMPDSFVVVATDNAY